jgi:outer membrane immunogenic protein
MNRILCGAAVVWFAVSAARAADWRGGYIGLSDASLASTSHIATSVSPQSIGTFGRRSAADIDSLGGGELDPTGIAVGLQGGYNWQRGPWVAGIDLGLHIFDGLADSKSAGEVYPCCAPYSFTFSQSVSTKWMLTVLPRAGWTFKDLLVYGMAGPALTRLHYVGTFAETLYQGRESVDSNGLKLGGAVGGGLEIALGSGLSLRAEYLYVDFGTLKLSGLMTTPIIGVYANLDHSADLSLSVLRAGIDFKFR